MRPDIRLVALLVLFPAAAGAQDGGADPLRSPTCVAARAELEALLAQPRAGRGGRLEQARRRVARNCLGAVDGARQRSGAADPPQVVAPANPIAPPPMQAPEVSPAPSPLSVPRPTAVTTCDPAGCWDSEGRRLNRMGPWLVGPGGVCGGLGGAVHCP